MRKSYPKGRVVLCRKLFAETQKFEGGGDFLTWDVFQEHNTNRLNESKCIIFLSGVHVLL
jgi:hypothetical protein